MTRRRWAALVAVVCSASVVVALAVVAGDPGGDGGDAATPPARAGGPDSTTDGTADISADGTEPAGAPPTDGDATGNAGIEAAPEGPGTELPGDAVAEDRRRSPADVSVVGADDVAEGALADAYPDRLLPPAPGSSVRSSSLSTSGDVVRVALVANGAPATRVLRFYRVHLATLGFDEVPTASAPGARAAAFRTGDGSVVVTAGPGSGDYTVVASLPARS